MTNRHAVVVGAGIGGLTAAVALHRRGWHVTVCERAPEPPATGAGIGLAPNALHALDAIGIDVARAVGSAVPATMGVRRPDGRWLTRVGTAHMATRYGVAPLAVPRPALTATLGHPSGAPPRPNGPFCVVRYTRGSGPVPTTPKCQRLWWIRAAPTRVSSVTAARHASGSDGAPAQGAVTAPSAS
ncbi:FAD-dependent oxidoreductase [Streptomyces avidinii]